MTTPNWQQILGWTSDQLEEIRFAGFSYLKEGRYEKALLFFKALVVVDPKSVYDTQTLGALYLQMGEGDEALACIEQALNLDPSHEPTLLNKAKTLLILGRKQEALLLLHSLQKSKNPSIEGDASALFLAYT